MTIMPPMNGPRAGPISVPERNHPMAVPRSVGRYMSPMQAAPIVRNEVPWTAVRIRKMKKAGRLGASAVPIEQAVKSADVMREI